MNVSSVVYGSNGRDDIIPILVFFFYKKLHIRLYYTYNIYE